MAYGYEYGFLGLSEESNPVDMKQNSGNSIINQYPQGILLIEQV